MCSIIPPSDVFIDQDYSSFSGSANFVSTFIDDDNDGIPTELEFDGDTDGDGIIDGEDDFPLDPTKGKDSDGDGILSYDEFKLLVRPLYDSSGAALRKIFELFDTDSSGYIDMAELSVMLQKLGLGKGLETKDALDRVFAAADVDGNGRVDFLEFTGLFPAAAASEAKEAAPSCAAL